ncbi:MULTISPECIES: hypothetical protein [unclassified Enterococcus]|uniref:DUF7006 family protein n=1 Tax=unclassified Enterococcus TaxID=2608891 RepID=UPI001552CF31|nr:MULTISPECIES: hypothetical protein [unclassified Enterococcus]MBS7576940.1 hypothetical protein [Enterococcus sp. MMGLQ5-2]MBS7584347.1 hypothetical protein [Enterococcus sp. MMGLQ5-1]NPD12202.1 hypothetical protein [Enterococcus sp. MMGLQ5-1]NPD36774.1 hypothetical protein [Enterococcus sp. MMGLQ5-2]
MKSFKNNFNYQQKWQIEVEVENSDAAILKNYNLTLLKELDTLIKEISSENFWEIIPKILGIDSKLNLLNFFLLESDAVSNSKEIIEIIEKDYLSYNKELCGYRLNETPSYSLIFDIK